MKELAARYLDGIATEAEVAELSSLLRGSDSARTDYLRLADVHSRLALDTALWTGAKAPTVIMSGSRFSWRNWAIPLAAAAIVTVLLIAGDRKEPVPPVPVATLLKSEDAAWLGRDLTEGARVGTGPLNLRGGSAILRLDGGATLLLSGPVEMRLESGGRVTLIRGEVGARVPEEAVGFTIQTPGGQLVDLGTEFVARVDKDSSTTVSVRDGEVEVHPKGDAANSLHTLTSGESLRLDRKGATFPVISISPSLAIAEVLREWKISEPRPRLLLRESFDYAPGDHDPVALNGGEGWEGPWTLLTDSEGARVYSGTNRRIRIERSGDTSAWVSPPGKSHRQRRLALPLDLSRDAVHYVSLRWREDVDAEVDAGDDLGDKPGDVVDESPTRGLHLTFRQLEGNSRGKIGLRIDHLFRPRIETGTGQGFVSRVKVSPEGRQLLVAKILSRREGDDEISLRVFGEDETPENWEPETWDIESRGVRLDAKLDHLVLQSGGPSSRAIEEIRVGTTWRSVVAPEP